MSHCVSCAISFHHECTSPEDGFCCCGSVTSISPTAVDVETKRGGPLKAPEDMLDPTSTGRKQAVKVKPLEPGMTCEWAGLKFAGGGVVPIIGCMGNEAKNVHHGPDKDTTNNDPEFNLHRICSTCHNRWHSLNDIYYGERPTAGTPFIPKMGQSRRHDGTTKAEPSEQYDHELWWSGSKASRTKYVNQPEVISNE